ncbi:MAG TPA: toll/interleukin-1 receptor domain-containing protein [Parafilimonas sp.]|nr:toll/interleukin-1 receptor domain-containing protein [Parafilimonas sp.]
MKIPAIYISHAIPDAPLALQLAKDLQQAGVQNVWLDQLNVTPGSDFFEETEQALKNADIVLVILSAETKNSDRILYEITVAYQSDKKVIPLVYKKVAMPLPLRKLSIIDLTTNYASGLLALSEQLKNIRVEEKLPGSPVIHPLPSGVPVEKSYGASGSKKKNVFKNIITALNPFKRKLRAGNEYTTAKPNGDVLLKMDNILITKPARGSDMDTKISEAEKDVFPEMTVDEPPPPKPAAVSPQVPPSPQPEKGKILYDIPGNMVVNQQQKCVIRIGKTEAIVRDDDTFSGNEVVENAPIAKVMNVELIDISEPKHFDIKTINSSEQEVEDDSYTQWLFWVTPLTAGNFSLLLKVSVIKIIDGKERRKELVFEKPVNIASQAAVVPQTPTGGFSQNLLEEKKLAEFDAPKVFVSYAHKDKDYFNVFIENLAAQSNWNMWTDKNIEIGSNWYERIQQAITDSDMAVLLVSAFFISSGFIKENEYQKFHDLQKSKPGFIFLPVLLRDTDITRWQSLARLQFFSVDGDDYDMPEFKGKLLPFAALCTFNNKGELNENFLRDTYFKNFVLKANTDWLKLKHGVA